jgi:transposase-like protein
MLTTQQQSQSWAQLPGESGPAYEAFRVFLELGTRRSVAEVVRRLGKKQSLIWRWVTRHDWRHRAWLWDAHQAGEDEAAVRQQREGALRERLKDLDRMGRACLVFFGTLVRRDPETGEAIFDAQFTPQVALRFLELALRAQGAFHQPTAEDKSDVRPAVDLFGLADAELMKLIELARERADQAYHGKENGSESHTSSTQQEQREQQEEPAEEEREQDEARRD